MGLEEQRLTLSEYGPEVKPLAGARRRLVRLEQKAAGTLPKKRGRRKKAPKAERLARTAKAREARAANRAVAKAAQPKIVQMTLTMPHWINGVAYGPGVVNVTPNLAAVFYENEQRVRQNDALTFGGGRAAFIGPNGRRIPVPMQTMDSPNLSMIEAFSL